jgi:hypothetical protein
MSLRRVLSEPAYLRAFNRIMAVLLGASLYPIFFWASVS